MIYRGIQKSKEEGNRMFSVLVDPDKYDDNRLLDLARTCEVCGVSYFFVGGSLMMSDRFEITIEILKKVASIPVVIFPGSNMQISSKADALLLLSLISGRNPDYLIGQHVIAAPYLRKSAVEIIPTGYILVDSGRTTTANYISNSLPVPFDKPEIAANTALAGEMLGLKTIYLDGGSGAGRTIGFEMVREVKESINIPLIVGGGICRADQAVELWSAGADMIVVGNAIEEDLTLIPTIASLIRTEI